MIKEAQISTSAHQRLSITGPSVEHTAFDYAREVVFGCESQSFIRRHKSSLVRQRAILRPAFGIEGTW